MTSTLPESGAPTRASAAELISSFSFARLKTANWRAMGSGDLVVRDLAVTEASGGRGLSAIVIRAGEIGGEIGLADSPWFAFVVVLKGEVLFQDSAGRHRAMPPSAAVDVTGYDARTKWRLAPGAEILAIASSIVLDPGDVLRKAESWSMYEDEQSAHVMGDGPRPYFLYRDLGAAAATDRSLNITIVTATGEVAGGTGWHTHSMSQFFYVLRGSVELAVAGEQPASMVVGDGMCIFAGLPHDVVSWSPDYACLELCAPADYDTVDAPQARALS